MSLDPDDISFSLSIELDIPPTPMGGRLVNLAADKKAKLKEIKVDSVSRYCPDQEEHVEFTDEQLNTLIIYEGEKIEFKHNNTRKVYHFSNKKATIKQFVDAIVDFEKIARTSGDWFGGIDCHHIFYEGIDPAGENGVYHITWGS